ncbi:hypothetical protein [Desertivibrio insolitus]|uniref:hypothetical protein n=1 Tax=Herbiconiux sp. SYSU D00978 TaxID=2812562 RepID=UPI001A9642F0|nr:hypothetical protein [Herbiconiux sp. SYSU D00978]
MSEQPPASYPAGNYGSPAPQQSKTLSIIGMSLGILGVLTGFFGWGLLFSIGAVVLGHMGQRRETAAKPFWLTALITGYVGIAINVIVLILLILAIVAAISVGGASTGGF